MKKIIVIILLAIVLFSMNSSFAKTKVDHYKHSKMTTTKEASKFKYVKCAVTGTKIDPSKAYSKTVYKGKTYYFCCAGCPEEFKKNPKKYIK